MTQSPLATDENYQLIASDKVDGTAVYNLKEEKLGAIHNLMVDKRSGQVKYAVMSFGGFLGIGEDYYPLPWSMLNYDTAIGGYRVDLDKKTLENAPSYSMGKEPLFDQDYNKRVYGHYGQTYTAYPM